MAKKVVEGVGHPENKTSFVGFVFLARGGSGAIRALARGRACVRGGAINRGETAYAWACAGVCACACVCVRVGVCVCARGRKIEGRSIPRVIYDHIYTAWAYAYARAYARERLGVYIWTSTGSRGARVFSRVWGRGLQGREGGGLTYSLTYDSIDIRGQENNRKDYMKEKLLKALQHEISICDKLNAEYRDEYFKKVGAGDEVGAHVLDDMRIQLHGEKYGLKTAINYIESILKD